MKRVALMIVVMTISFAVMAQVRSYQSFKDASGKMGFKAEDGAVLIKPQYDSVGRFYSDYCLVKLKGKYGMIDTLGKWAVPNKYDGVRMVSEKMFAVGEGCTADRYGSFTGGKWGFTDLSGKLVVPIIYPDVYDFASGFAAVNIGGTPASYGVSGGKWGFVDTKGKLVIPAEYTLVKDFSDNMAPVQKNDKWGYIDEKGKVVVPLQYLDAKKFGGGYAPVKRNLMVSEITSVATASLPKWTLIDKTGREVAKPSLDDCNEMIFGRAAAAIEENGWGFSKKWGFVNQRLEWVVLPYFDEVKTFSAEGYAPVSKNKKWGFVDRNGKEAVPLLFNNAYPFSDGKAYVVLPDNTIKTITIQDILSGGRTAQ